MGRRFSLLNPLLTQAQTWGIPGIFAAVNDHHGYEHHGTMDPLYSTKLFWGKTAITPNLSENSEPDLLKNLKGA